METVVVCAAGLARDPHGVTVTFFPISEENTEATSGLESLR